MGASHSQQPSAGVGVPACAADSATPDGEGVEAPPSLDALPCELLVAIGSCLPLETGDKEEALVAAVAQYGPVSICIDAEESFIKYKSGVYNGPCSSDVWKQNHCVSIVGYDVEEKYWLVRNTWGTGWGEDGYIRMAMGSNLCGITNEATIANVSKA